MAEHNHPKPIRVVIADDHLMVRKGLRLMLEEEGGADIEWVGDVADGAEALAIVEKLQPDVVLMDVRMPNMDGITALKHIRANWPQVAILILTTYDEDDLVIRGLQAGASGYLLKAAPMATLLKAIRMAAKGEMLLQPEIMARVLAHAQANLASPTPATPKVKLKPVFGAGIAISLTKREQEVLEGLARGERRKEIALRLGITERTVRAYLDNVYSKLGVYFAFISSSCSFRVWFFARHLSRPLNEAEDYQLISQCTKSTALSPN